ncbi:hypothetical protein CK220_24465 [Mesorhizobium sp. WSM3860]|nr:hypothetical protein CK220_24465 [Mesorhizobium sp. WSM3860]
MAIFFFDIYDTGETILDPEGVELDGIDAATDEAARALIEMANDIVPDGAWRDLAIKVRDAEGQEVAHVRITVEVQSKT